MAWRVLYNSTTDVAELINEGAVTSKDLFDGVMACYHLGIEKGSLKFLADSSKREKFKGSIFDYYKVPEMFAKMPEIRRARIAVLLPTGKCFDAGVRFFETVCLNRGYLVQTFTTRHAAEEWLNKLEDKL